MELELPATPTCEFFAARVSATGSVRQACIDVMAAKLPLDPELYEIIEGMLRQRRLPPRERKRIERQLQNGLYLCARHVLRQKGVRAAEAEERAAAVIGKTVDAIKQQIKRMQRVSTPFTFTRRRK
jgi:hypothetical protein